MNRWLHNNNLNGSIPESIGNSKKIRTLKYKNTFFNSILIIINIFKIYIYLTYINNILLLLINNQ